MASGGNPWAGQINGNLQLNSGTVDLFGSSGQNSRQQQFYGTGGTLTNTSATAGVLGISARNNTAYTFAGTIQDGTGTVGIDFSNQGTTNSGAHQPLHRREHLQRHHHDQLRHRTSWATPWPRRTARSSSTRRAAWARTAPIRSRRPIRWPSPTASAPSPSAASPARATSPSPTSGAPPQA